MLSRYDRDEYRLGAKVGRVISEEHEPKEGPFADGRQKKIITDYSTDSVKRSIEQSLQRLQTDRLDYVFVHDVSRDFHGDDWIACL